MASFNKAVRDAGLSINFGGRGERTVRNNQESKEYGFGRGRSRGNSSDSGGRWIRGGGRYPSRGGRGRPGFRGSRGRGNYHPRSRIEDEEGDIDMGNDRSRTRRSHPYGQGERQRNFRERSPPQRIDPDEESWKVLIPDAIKHSQSWLIKRLQTLCRDELKPINVHTFRENVVFFVDNFNVADSLRKGTNRITTKDGSRITILVKPGRPPKFTDQADEPVVIETDSQKLDILKQFLGQRYDPNLIKLDLSNIYNDQILKTNGMERRIYDVKLMNTILKLIHDICPQLKILDVSNNRINNLKLFHQLPTMCPDLEELNLSDNSLHVLGELVKVKSLKNLRKIWLKGNPGIADFRTESVYHAEVRERLPDIEEIDGIKLPPSIKVGLDVTCTLPEYKDNYTASEEASTLIAQFLKNFFLVYDSEDISDRQQLLQAYHDQATFSFCINASVFNTEDPNSVAFKDILKKGRNLLKIKDRNLRLQFIKNKKLSVVAFLMELPKTKHKLGTFSLDVILVTSACLSFVVHGVFLEGETLIPRSFSRSFVVVPETKSDSPFSIINDSLVIRNATEGQLKKLNITESFQEAVSSSNTQNVPAEITTEQQQLVLKFSAESKMNVKWSLDALIQNDWNFEQAAMKFAELKAGGTIPPEAFQ